MSYESDCDDYALFGDPERDHYDYEENARYDQYDGLRADFAEEFGFEDDPGCPDCGYRADCADCKQAAADYAEFEASLEKADYDDSEVPF
jgi:hypothetical protein